jgi:predicted dehydrogenase
MAAVRVGVVGTGGITTAVHLPVLRNLPGVEVAWLADRHAPAAAAAARAFGVGRVAALGDPLDLPDCDLALLAVPLHARAPYLRFFAGRGTAVFTEKPFAVTAAEHREYLGWFGGRPVACGYMRRTYAGVRALALLLRHGWLGPLRAIRYAEGARVTSGGAGAALLDRPHHEGGGVLRDLGCHGIDLVGVLTGQPAWRDVAAEIAWDGATDRQVRARFTLALADGPCAVDFAVTWLGDTANELALVFDRAVVATGLRPDGGLTIADPAPGAPRRRLDLDAGGARTFYQAFGLEWQAVLAGLAAGRAGEFDAAGSLWTTELVAALYAAGGAP